MNDDTSRLRLFVFGTLRRGQWNHERLAGRYRDVVEATLPGYRRTAPLMIAPDPDGIAEVRGELFDLDPDRYVETLRHCDELEGIPPGELVGDDYQRVRVRVVTAIGDFDAWAYVATAT